MWQARDGIVWFATEVGICRFNGYTFTRPIDTSSTAGNEVLKIVEAPQGRIWFNHLDGSLYFIENDTIRSWQFNYLARDFAQRYRQLFRFAVEADGTVWITSKTGGFLVVHPDGQPQIVPSQYQNAVIFCELNGTILATEQASRAAVIIEKRDFTREVLHWKDGNIQSLGKFSIHFTKSIPGTNFTVWRLKNGDLVAFYWKTFYIIRHDRLVWQGQKDLRANYLAEDAEGNILLASLRGKSQGLLRYRSLAHFQRDESENLLPGRIVSAFCCDQEGGYWAATTNAGVFYCKNPRLTIFDYANGAPLLDAVTLSNDGINTVFAGQSSRGIYAINRLNGHVDPIPPPRIEDETQLTLLRFDTTTGRLWSGPWLCFWEKKHWTQLQVLLPNQVWPSNVYVKKINASPDNKYWWASAPAGFYSIDPGSGVCVRIPTGRAGIQRTFSVTSDAAGHLWVATMDGLRLWCDTAYALPPFQHPALRFKAQQIELLPEGGMVIALNGGGLLIRDKSGQFLQLTTGNGLSANQFTDLDLGPKGVIYASSNAGLNILTPQSDGSWRIETLTTKHGLPSNQVNDVTWLHGELWVATDKGVARLKGKPVAVPMPAPQLDHFRINNQYHGFTTGMRLTYRQNNISLRFFALHFRSGGDIPYRYRLLGADTNFVYTHTREINFANLTSGPYTFEVQAQNEDGQWSASALWPFEICPPWWRTWWFYGVLMGAFVAISGLFYQNRLRVIKREAAEREKIRDLESAALRAQMNPHFIFNCLQSIQSFIAQNDRDAASTYLAKFAKLVRLSLHGSMDGRHTLSEEIAMLDCYLHLEQMRFNYKFTFHIHLDADTNGEEIFLPPLLVQPYVENALVHGLRGRTNGGVIEVFFTKNKAVLEVLVCDNGVGTDRLAVEKETRHPYKSVGMLLTQKRLNLLNQHQSILPGTFVLEEVLDSTGKFSGSQVRLVIPV